jgi:pimeloyl-ACP methyl ester carboxylesterase
LLFMVRLTGYALMVASLASPRLAGRLAFGLFAYPGPRARVRGSEQSVHDRAEVEPLPVAGERVVSYRWGDGSRPVLLVHGWGGRGSRFAALVPALQANGFSAITFDAPGHGESSGRSTHILGLEAIIHRLSERYGRFEAVIGHSFGVLPVFKALRSGVAAGRVVAISGPSDLGYLPEKFAEQLGLGRRVRADLRRRMERFFASEPNIWETFSAPYQSSALQLPILIVHDQDDPVVDPDQAHRLAEAYAPWARLVTTRGVGHHRILATPEVIDQIVDLLNREDPAGHSQPLLRAV